MGGQLILNVLYTHIFLFWGKYLQTFLPDYFIALICKYSIYYKLTFTFLEHWAEWLSEVFRNFTS